MSRSFFVLCLLTLFSSVSVASATPNKRIVNVYTTRHYEADQKLAADFEKKSGIGVRFVQIKEPSQLIARISEEKEKTEADVLMTTDVGNLWRASEGGLFQKIDSKVVRKEVPSAYRDANDLWTGVAMRVRLIAFHKEKVKPELVARLEDLAAPTLKGRVLVRSSNHVYNQSLAASLLAGMGRDALITWSKGVTANLARKPQGGDTDQIKAIAAGEGDVAIVNSYYVARLLDSKVPSEQELMKNIAVVFPNQKDRGSHANLSGAGITKHAKNVENARLFIEYLVSREGQQIFSIESREYAVRSDVPSPASLASFGTPKLDIKGLSLIGKHTPDAIRILEEAGWR